MDVRKISVSLILAALISFNVCYAEKILADTSKKSDAYFLALVKNDNDSLLFYIYDNAGNEMAFIPYNRDLYDFYLTQDEYGLYSPAIFKMFIRENPGGTDTDLGAWEGYMHILPVYALFDYVDGKILIEYPFWSGEVLNPSHYHNAIKEAVHTKLLEVFLTHMPTLHEAVEAKGIILPRGSANDND